jgi:uncharacterized protein YfaS (alpha-2-macroglobulin family)
LRGGFGQVFVQVEPATETAAVKGKPMRVNGYQQNKVEAWVQKTNIALDAFADKNQLVVWANSLADGAPLAGVEMRVSPDNLAGTTGADGLTRLDFKNATKPSELKQPSLLVARRGDDVAILPQNYYSHYYDINNEGTSWRRADTDETLSWYVFDDRKLYRPGEEVNVKGWIRKVNLTPTGDTEMYAAANRTIAYTLKDAQGNDVTKGTTTLNALAGFTLKLQLPRR